MGIDDANEGVQWNAWVEWKDNGLITGYVGVNLEGKQYDGWPISRLIERELDSFALFNVFADVDHPKEITVRWSRDVWVGSRLPPNYPEFRILSARLSEITDDKDKWREVLATAQGCLNQERGFRGRARQPITVSGGAKYLDVSPHLQFGREAWHGELPSEVDLAKQMRDIRRQLLSLYTKVSVLSSSISDPAEWTADPPESSVEPSGNGRPPSLGMPYVRANETATISPSQPFDVDPDVVDRGVRGHAVTQNRIADHLREREIEVRSPLPAEPRFDLAWTAGDLTYIAEIKSLTAENEENQLRLGLGQVLQYRYLLEKGGRKVVPVLVPENEPRDGDWLGLCEQCGVILIWPESAPLVIDGLIRE